MNLAKFLLGFMLSGAAFALVAQEKSEENKIKLDSYIDFQWLPVNVASENPNSEVRNQFDFSLPLHGPYLTNPSGDSITINWISRVPCAGGVEYREKGAETFNRVWKKFYGQIDCSDDLHSIHLHGLKPGTEYEYRLVAFADKSVAYENSVFAGREIYSFRTLDPKREKYQVFFTADLHGAARLILDPMIKAASGETADFYAFLGDNVEDNLNNARYFLTQGVLDDVVRKWGKNKPSVFLRGNHDLSGLQQYEFGRYFPRVDGKTYFAFSQGRVLFIVLDSLWQSNAIKEQNIAYQEYLLEQVRWLESLKKSAAWKNSEFRVVMAHVATHGGSTQYMADIFKNVLNDNTPEGRIHYFLAGHEHSYIRVDPGNDFAKVSSPKSIRPFPGDFNYGILIADQQDALIMNVEPGKLTFTSYNWTNGEVRDSFRVDADGKVTDMIDNVKVFPPPNRKK